MSSDLIKPNPENLKKLRKRYHYRQEDFGRMIGKSKSNYGRKEKGDVPLPITEYNTILERVKKEHPDCDIPTLDQQSGQAGTFLRPEIAEEMPLVKSIVEYANAQDWETVALLAGQLYKRLRQEDGEKKQIEPVERNFSTG